MKFCTSLLTTLLAVGAVQPYAIDPYHAVFSGNVHLFDTELENSETSLLRERRSPQGTIGVNAGVGPGRTGSVGVDYSQVWKDGNRGSLGLSGSYAGQFGQGKPQHNFGVGAERKWSEGSIGVNAGVGPGRTGNAGVNYNHQVWKGRNGQSFELGGNYMGQFGQGRPNHNFGVGGTFRF